MVGVGTVQFQGSPGPDAPDVGLDLVAAERWRQHLDVHVRECIIVLEAVGRGIERRQEGRDGVLGPIGRFVGAVGGLRGCETDAVVALDLGREVSGSGGGVRSGVLVTMMMVLSVRID